MLVLTRRLDEEIVVPDFNVTITVVEIRKNKVRLGITAPSHVAVHRQEVWARIAAEEQDKLPQRVEAGG